MTCRNLAKLQNDATACFDIMVTNLTTLYCRLHNVPELACNIQSTTLNKMKYKIITALGTSKKSILQIQKNRFMEQAKALVYQEVTGSLPVFQ